jgi:hypothetical protein
VVTSFERAVQSRRWHRGRVVGGPV